MLYCFDVLQLNKYIAKLVFNNRLGNYIGCHNSMVKS